MDNTFDFNTVLTVFFGGIYSLGALAIFIWALTVFFSTEIQLNDTYKKVCKHGVILFLVLSILSFIFMIINKRLTVMIEIYQEPLSQLGVDNLSYSGWMVIYTIIFSASLVFSLLIIYMYIGAGFKISSKTNLPSFPILLKEKDTNPIINKIDFKHIAVIAGSVLGFSIFTFILFKLTNVQISENIKEISDKLLSKGISMDKLDIYSYIILIFAAIREELVFRFVGQRLLFSIFTNKKAGLWVSIILISMIWSFGHFGMVEPVLVKVLQIFIFGILLGLVSHYRGIGSVILIHLFFNVAMGVINPYLF